MLLNSNITFFRSLASHYTHETLTFFILVDQTQYIFVMVSVVILIDLCPWCFVVGREPLAQLQRAKLGVSNLSTLTRGC